jgi:hypothetical protein
MSDSWCQDFIDIYGEKMHIDEKAFLNDVIADERHNLNKFDPSWKEGVNGELILKMWCPCGRKSKHRIRVPITTVGKETPWRRNGPNFNTLTVAPVIDTGCWHGYIEEGRVRTA